MSTRTGSPAPPLPPRERRTFATLLLDLLLATLFFGELAWLGASATRQEAAILVGGVLEDEGAELVGTIGHAAVAACLAVKDNVVLLVNLHGRLRQRAPRAEDKLLDKLVDKGLEHVRVMGAIHRARADVLVILRYGP